MHKKLLLLLTFLVLIPFSFSTAQLFVENFDYPVGDSLTQHGWAAHSGTSNAIFVTSPGLTYSGYPSSGIGNAATLTTTGQDVNQQFTPITSGAIYAGIMVNVSSAQTGDYFFHLGLSNTTSIYMGRVYVKLASNGNLSFGLSKTSIGGALSIQPVYSDSVYTTGITYLLVLKYQFNPDVNDDTVSLFINPDISTTEPAPDLVHGTSNNDDPANIGGVYIRQGGSSIASNLILDGIRIATTWSEIIPVELTSFSANALNGNVVLNWTTATELNNSGFEVQRKMNNEFESIGFVPGFGTTTKIHNYTFTDRNLSNGNYVYRLKQVDFDGSFTYSNEVNADVNAPAKFELGQNYPNPFNPSTKITFSIPQNSEVSLKVFNVLGQEVTSLVNGFMNAGTHTVDFNSVDMNSGIYFYKLEAGSFSEVRKMTLLK